MNHAARLALLTCLLAALGQAQSEYRLPDDKLMKAEALYRTGVVMHVAGTLYGFVVLVLLLVSGTAVKFRSWAEAVSSRPWVQALVFASLLFLSIDLLGLPLRIYGQHLQQSYGLSVQSWASWWRDWLKGEQVNRQEEQRREDQGLYPVAGANRFGPTAKLDCGARDQQ